MFDTYFPILFLLVLTIVMAIAMSLISVLIGKRTRLGHKLDPYECGIPPVGTTREPVPVKFYMVAILFIIFDLEVVFLFPWAVIARDLGVFGLVEMLVFVAILMVGYFYILGRGALRWD